VRAAETYNGSEPVNLGRGEEVPIARLAEIIAARTGFSGEIVWDRTKPDGQPRRMLDVERAAREFGFRAPTSLDEGLDRTITWFVQQTR
jgi:GDP-L-fucose synthase